MTLSKPSFKIIRPYLSYGMNIIREAAQELFSMIYGIEVNLKATGIIKHLWENAGRDRYWINLPLFFDSKDKVNLIS